MRQFQVSFDLKHQSLFWSPPRFSIRSLQFYFSSNPVFGWIGPTLSRFRRSFIQCKVFVNPTPTNQSLISMVLLCALGSKWLRIGRRSTCDRKGRRGLGCWSERDSSLGFLSIGFWRVVRSVEFWIPSRRWECWCRWFISFCLPRRLPLRICQTCEVQSSS